jgi:hypothetical protein
LSHGFASHDAADEWEVLFLMVEKLDAFGREIDVPAVVYSAKKWLAFFGYSWQTGGVLAQNALTNWLKGGGKLTI